MDSLHLLLIWGIPVLFAITLHEVAHGWVAYCLGDQTARWLGRLSLNPIKHIDLWGTVIIPGALLLMGQGVFGWAKPVPVNERNLRNPHRDMALVALAGPASNLLMALFWATVWRSTPYWSHGLSEASVQLFLYMSRVGIFTNLILAVLNLLPILPLDGGRVLRGFLPARYARHFDAIEPYGIWVVLLLWASGWLADLIQPAVTLLYGYLV